MAEMVERLSRHGITVTRRQLDEQRGSADVAYSRPHLARALVKAGYAASFAQAFARLIGNHCPAYVPTRIATPVEVTRVVLAAGGIPVWAHPPAEHFRRLLPGLVDAGLRGLEVYRATRVYIGVGELEDVARREGLVLTGGSDWHGPESGSDLGDFYVTGEVPYISVANLFNLPNMVGWEMTKGRLGRDREGVCATASDAPVLRRGVPVLRACAEPGRGRGGALAGPAPPRFRSSRRFLAVLALAASSACERTDSFDLHLDVVALAVVLVAGEDEARMLAVHPHRQPGDAAPEIAATLEGPGWKAPFSRTLELEACAGLLTGPVPSVCLGATPPEAIRPGGGCGIRGTTPLGAFTAEMRFPTPPLLVEPADTLRLSGRDVRFRTLPIPMRYQVPADVGTLLAELHDFAGEYRLPDFHVMVDRGTTGGTLRVSRWTGPCASPCAFWGSAGTTRTS